MGGGAGRMLLALVMACLLLNTAQTAKPVETKAASSKQSKAKPNKVTDTETAGSDRSRSTRTEDGDTYRGYNATHARVAVVLGTAGAPARTAGGACGVHIM
jgi:opacity protein-like surface antigen